MISEKITVGDVVKNNMIEYGTYVLENRAIPDFRDGLKPVHRRLLFSMYSNKIYCDSNFRKCSLTVGDTMGKFHPHGDASLYEALVNMHHARYPLVQGSGNFGKANCGSIYVSAGAYRYTEARLSKLGQLLFDCNETIPYVKNFTGEYDEPLYITSKLPIYLLNGSSGIAVGISDEIPPHNLKEVLNAAKLFLKKKKVKLKHILKYIKAPDYTTGFITSSKEEIRSMYKTGEGSLQYKCGYHFEDDKQQGGKKLVIDAYAPYFRIDPFIEKMGLLSKEKLIKYVVDLSSKKYDQRIEIGLLTLDVFKQKILPYLKTSVTYRFYYTERINENEVRIQSSNLVSYLKHWVHYRKELEKRIIDIEIGRLNVKLEREEFKLKAIKNFAKIAKLLVDKTLQNDDKIKQFKVILDTDSDELIKYILESNLWSLNNSSDDKQQKVIDETKDKIKEQKWRLNNISDILIKEWDSFIQKYGDDRRMLQAAEETEQQQEEAIKTELFATINKNGKLDKFHNINEAKHLQKWDYIIKSCKGFTVIKKDGFATQIKFNDLMGNDCGQKDIVGVIPLEKEMILTLCENGMGTVIESQQSKKNYKVLKNDNVILSCGVSKGDRFITWDKSKDKLHEEKITKSIRRNSKGWRLFPRRTATDFFIIPKNGCVVNHRGNEIIDYLALLKGDIQYFIIGDKNLIICKTKRFVLNKKQTLQILQTTKNKIQKIINL